MAKITRKSINDLMESYKQGNTDIILKLTDPAKENTTVMEVEVKTDLTVCEKSAFVNRVANSCFDENNNFMPEYLEPVFMITLLQMTTNVPVFSDKRASVNKDDANAVVDIERTYELCKVINLPENMNDANYQSLISELRQMVNSKIAYMKEVNIRKASSFLKLLEPVLNEIKDAVTNNPDLTELLNLMKNAANESADNILSFQKRK